MRDLLYFFLVLAALATTAQKRKVQDTSLFITQPYRVEFQMDEWGQQYHVVPGQEAGLLVLVSTEERLDAGFKWVMHGLDTALNQRWSRLYSVPLESFFNGYDFFGGKYFLLFNTPNFRQEEMIILEIDAYTGALVEHRLKNVFPLQLTQFEVLDNNMLLGGYTNFRPVLMRYQLGTNRPMVVPGFYENFTDLTGLVIDDQEGLFTTVQLERMNNRRNTVRSKTFTANADLIQNNAVEPGEKRNLVDGSSTIFYGGFQYIAGTYSKKISQYSRGLYLAKFLNGSQQFIKYYDYHELDNFFGYMSPKREERVKKRIERKKEKGKRPQFSYRLLIHEIIQRGDEYILIAEAYYPRYSSYSAPGPGSFGPGQFNPSFLGYRYTHAIVVGFDRNGNILWDNSFAINDVDQYTLDPYVTVKVMDEGVVLMYLDKNTIRTKIIQGREIVEGKTFNPVKLTYQTDEVRSKDPDVEGLEPWFGQSLYAYGEQYIYNEGGEAGLSFRRIFYINRVEFKMNNEE